MRNFLLLSAFIAFPTLSALAADKASSVDKVSTYDRVISKNELVCGIYSWAPYKEQDPQTGEWKGFAIDIYRKAFATLDIKVTFKEVSLGNQAEELNAGRIDAMCDDGPWILSEGKFVEYSDPAYVSFVYPYVRADEKRFRSRADLNSADFSFAGVEDDLSTDLPKRLFPQAKIINFPAKTDTMQPYINVASGKADIVIGDPATFSLYNKTNPGKLKPVFLEKPIAKYKNAISVKKGDLRMLGLVNEAIDNALALGIIDDVLDDFDPQHKLLMRVKLPYSF